MQGHIAMGVIVSIKKSQLLVSVSIGAGIIAIKYDNLWRRALGSFKMGN
jgi:hypothetical protein